MNEKIKIIANEKCWIEQTAIDQVNGLLSLDDAIDIVGLPDLHAGKHPIGVVVTTKNKIYPFLIGSDIGCGMSLFETNCQLRKFKQNRFVSRLNNIKSLDDIHIENPYDEDSPIFDLGTIGSGNHFAEFQKVHEVFDDKSFDELGLDKQQLLLLIHSGSRGYGQRILNQFSSYDGYDADSMFGKEYLFLHDDALMWASRNRHLTAQKLINHVGYSTELKEIINCSHNFLQKEDGIYHHRKGAVSALEGMVVIPGSRGSLTYIVKPAEDTSFSAHSLSHGAGRKWARSLCKSRIKNRYDRDSIRQTRLGSHTVCHDTNLLFQEAPEAYKNIDDIIKTLTDNNLCTVVATLCPLITYKG